MIVKELPVLYKKTSTGKIQKHLLRVVEKEGNFYIQTLHGLLDGKITATNPKIIKGKNKGKRNETTDKEQAILESQSKWTKKKDKDYFETIEETENIVPVFPMLAQKFQDRKKYITFPCIVQRKFDGIRSIISKNEDGTIVIKSRMGKMFYHLEHITDEFKDIVSGVHIDGELYSDDLTFEEIVGIVRTEKSTKNLKKLQIQMYCYDYFDLNNIELDFVNRFKKLGIILKNKKNVNYVESITVENEKEIMKYHKQFISEGYEGIIIRQLNGKYELNKRSNFLQKYKQFQDGEFKITGFKSGKGNEKGCIIWECTSDNGTFDVRPKGTHTQRKELFDNGKDYIGKLLTVRFIELTTKGIPKHATGITIRDYE